MNLQNKNLLIGYIFDVFKLKIIVEGTIIKIKIERTKATTPPSIYIFLMRYQRLTTLII
jgi:hypothetical protein